MCAVRDDSTRSSLVACTQRTSRTISPTRMPFASWPCTHWITLICYRRLEHVSRNWFEVIWTEGNTGKGFLMTHWCLCSNEFTCTWILIYLYTHISYLSLYIARYWWVVGHSSPSFRRVMMNWVTLSFTSNPLCICWLSMPMWDWRLRQRRLYVYWWLYLLVFIICVYWWWWMMMIDFHVLTIFIYLFIIIITTQMNNTYNQ